MSQHYFTRAFVSRSPGRLRLALMIAFFAALTYLLSAITANAFNSSLSALNPFLKAPFYLLPGLVLFAMLYSGVPKLRRLPAQLYLLILCFWTVLLIGISVGGIKVATGSSLALYYIGDGLKFVSSWLSFLTVATLAYLVCKDDINGSASRNLVRMCLILAALEAAGILALAAQLEYWQKIHLSAASAIGFGLFYTPPKTIVRVSVLLLGLGAAALSGKRAGLALPIIAVSITVLLTMPRAVFRLGTKYPVKSTHYQTFTVLALVILVGAVMSTIFGAQFENRYDAMYGSLLTFVTEKITGAEVTDQSMNSRYAEMENVQRFYSDNPLQILFGGGFGAATPMYEDTGVVAIDGNMHHVHAGWWVYLLRNGLIGDLLLAIYFGVTIWIALSGSRAGIETSKWLLFLLVYQAAASYKSNTMLDSIEFTIPILFGATLADLHRRSLQRS